MEHLFKQNLLRIRTQRDPQTFAGAIMGVTDWVKKDALKTKDLIPQEKEMSTERGQVLDSLEKFIQDKIEKTGVSTIPVEGGEIVVKPKADWEGIYLASNKAELIESLSIDPRIIDIILKDKLPGQVQVVFVTESFRSWQEIEPELQSGFLNELIMGLPLKTAQLFERMIAAMKLMPTEVAIYPVESDVDLSLEVMAIIAYLRPLIVITLGAKATQKILKGNDRLSLIHGHFFKKEIENLNPFQIVPLFHPSIIETNQNMKKTAWADMQKIMKYLKKLP